MNQLNAVVNGKVIYRISKLLARKKFISGISIFLLPCKLAIDNKSIPPYEINKQNTQKDFDNIVSEYEKVVCINSQLGRYAAYYIFVN